MKKIKKIVILIELIILLSVCIYFIFMYFSTRKEDVINKTEIEEYGYYLKNTDSELFEQYFNELSEELSKEDIDYENYAKLISKLFVIDFYTLNNKRDNKDIGGLQFINSEFEENFKLNATNTMYKYIVPNYDNKRIQELPIVKSVEVVNIEVLENYEIELSWEYLKDLGYENKGLFIIEKEENKLYIIEKNEI